MSLLWVPWYCLPTGGGYTVDTYLDLLRGAAAAMKSADPTCKVIRGLSIIAQARWETSLSGRADWITWTSTICTPTRMIGLESFIQWMERILGVMDAQGGRNPSGLRSSAIGPPTTSPGGPGPPKSGHWSANRQQANQREAADYTVRLAGILLAHGVEKVFWHSGLEGAVNNGSMDLETPSRSGGGPPEAVRRPGRIVALVGFYAKIRGPVSEARNRFGPGRRASMATPLKCMRRGSGCLGTRRAEQRQYAEATERYPWATLRVSQDIYDDGPGLACACTLLRDTAGDSGWALEVPHGVSVQTVVGTPMHPAGPGPSDAFPSQKPHPVIPRPDGSGTDQRKWGLARKFYKLRSRRLMKCSG